MSYKESLGLALQEGALDVVLTLVGAGTEDAVLCHETLRMLASLLSHRKFSLVFIESGGLRWCPPAPTPATPHILPDLPVPLPSSSRPATLLRCTLPRLCSPPPAFPTRIQPPTPADPTSRQAQPAAPPAPPRRPPCPAHRSLS
jgi:hypothetical protein